MLTGVSCVASAADDACYGCCLVDRLLSWLLSHWHAYSQLDEPNSSADDSCAVGDTLFALGCGRLFEGDAQMMWLSLSKLLPLPADTLVYCAHEYSQSNARFAVSVDPNNAALQDRKKRIDEARSRVSQMTAVSWWIYSP